MAPGLLHRGKGEVAKLYKENRNKEFNFKVSRESDVLFCIHDPVKIRRADPNQLWKAKTSLCIHNR